MLKPKQATSEEVVVGFLDVGKNKEKKANGRGSLKKLARAQGPAEGGVVIAQKEEQVRTKRIRKQKSKKQRR